MRSGKVDIITLGEGARLQRGCSLGRFTATVDSCIGQVGAQGLPHRLLDLAGNRLNGALHRGRPERPLRKEGGGRSRRLWAYRRCQAGCAREAEVRLARRDQPHRSNRLPGIMIGSAARERWRQVEHLGWSWRCLGKSLNVHRAGDQRYGRCADQGRQLGRRRGLRLEGRVNIFRGSSNQVGGCLGCQGERLGCRRGCVARPLDVRRTGEVDWSGDIGVGRQRGRAGLRLRHPRHRGRFERENSRLSWRPLSPVRDLGQRGSQPKPTGLAQR